MSFRILICWFLSICLVISSACVINYYQFGSVTDTLVPEKSGISETDNPYTLPGLNNKPAKHYLPKEYIDFLYVYMVEEYGVLPVNAVLSLLWIPVLICLLVIANLYKTVSPAIKISKLRKAHLISVTVTIAVISIALWELGTLSLLEPFLLHAMLYSFFGTLLWLLVIRKEKEKSSGR